MKTFLKSILTILVFSQTLIIAQDGPLVAGEGEKKVITSGYGKNPDEALAQALRNAVEEAVGTYMTSTTRMENSEIIEDKILSAAIGLIIVPVSLALLALFGIAVPFVFPAAGSLVLALVGFFAPDADVKTRAASARLEFTRALAAFIDFVSLNRSGGVAAFQSLERAAAVGDSWVFLRLDAELQKASLAGQAPWAALSNLAAELALPELGDLADIMTYTGDQGASVADTLAARAGALRSALLSKEQGEAGAKTKKMDAPLGALAVLFMIMLLVPAAVNIMGI